MLVADGSMEFLYSAATVVGMNHPPGIYLPSGGGTLRPLLGCQEGLSLNMHPMKLADFSLIYGLVNMSKF